MTLNEVLKNELYKEGVETITAYSKDSLDFIVMNALENGINKWIMENSKFSGKLNAHNVKIDNKRYTNICFNSKNICFITTSFNYGRAKDKSGKVYLKNFEVLFENGNADFETLLLEKLSYHKEQIKKSIEDKLKEIEEIENFLLTN